jgi:alkylation response protein AidB-like acyl-CoA dehydrogenase
MVAAFISNGYDAKLYVIYANTDPKKGIRDATSSFLVPRDTPGLTITRCNEKMGGRYMNNGEFVLDDCRIPEDHLLVKDIALPKAGVYFAPGKILQAAKALGVGVAAYEDTAAYVQQHVQGGRVLIKHQIIAAALANMAIKLETVRAMTHHAAKAVDEGASDANALCLMAKVYSSEAVFDVCRQPMELHGGTGVMLEAGIEKHFRDAAVFLHMDGTQDIHRFKIVRSMFPDTAGV